MEFLGQTIAPLGMGCWPIGGAMYSGTQSLGYTGADDAVSVRTLHAALDAGISVFDTAAAYGAGHSERLLARALKGRPDALIVTKIGIAIDEDSKQLTFDLPKPGDVGPAIDACLRRLERDRIDLMLLHQNDMPIDAAQAIFDAMETAREAGKVRAFGWSTDYADRTDAMAARAGFVAVEHAMNVFFDAPRVQSKVVEHGLVALNRSPLAMGVLSGKYSDGQHVPQTDIRASSASWMEYFKDGTANPEFVASLEAVRALLQTGGRSLVQGALGWLWAKGEHNIPIPGARTEEQITGLASALEYGPLPPNVMVEIETLMPRTLSEPDRPR